MIEIAYIGLGSNLGDREGWLESARVGLSKIPGISVTDASSLFDSAPFGPTQPRYLNAAVQINSALDPLTLLKEMKQLERRLGRKDAARWQPRQIDLDLLCFGNRTVAESKLRVPHPELHLRRFVLEPLCELNGLLSHPVLRKTVKEMLAETLNQDVARWDSTRWSR